MTAREVQTGVRCPGCGEEIYSNSRHDFVTCRCGQTSVDGGWDYLRVIGAIHAERIAREVDREQLPRFFRLRSKR